MEKKDVQGVDFISFRKPNKFDITGVVNFPHEHHETVDVRINWIDLFIIYILDIQQFKFFLFFFIFLYHDLHLFFFN